MSTRLYGELEIPLVKETKNSNSKIVVYRELLITAMFGVYFKRYNQLRLQRRDNTYIHGYASY